MAVLPARRAMELSEMGVFRLAEQLCRGITPEEMARRAYPDDRARRRSLRRRIERYILVDQRIAQQVHQSAHLTLLAGLGPATHAVAGRAARGRIDAAKLLYEASGFHNPRIKHEHTGDIRIKLELPRPKFDAEGSISDAEVVP